MIKTFLSNPSDLFAFVHVLLTYVINLPFLARAAQRYLGLTFLAIILIIGVTLKCTLYFHFISL